MGYRRIFFLMFILFLMLPLGLLTDAPAWGEWDLSFYEKAIGFIPEGMKKGNVIDPLIQDYSLEGLPPAVSYYLSAFIGTALIFLSFYWIKIIRKKDER
ncbi:MAG TPA: hypothetical protein ENK22_00205 [Persephonella sp.]|nr:hypothetical protein [Persephonella sp.]